MTMVELLITIVVVTILLALGVPSFQEFIKNNRLTAQTNDFVTAVQLARSEAVKRGSFTTICASTDQATCDVADGNWSSGWIVFSDLDRDGVPDVGAAAPLCEETEDCMLRTSDGLTKVAMDGVPVNDVLFGPTGMPVDEPLGTFPVTFTMNAYNCKFEQVRDIQITKMGHMTVSKQACP
ncbi:MAG: GspH/FimT family pseudopilin [Gammaproteobacteria bacterium]|nr:GspH/FimT family pseudopilin [Gammaproteobacteria bacterium]